MGNNLCKLMEEKKLTAYRVGGLFPRLYFLPHTKSNKLGQIHAALFGCCLPCCFFSLRYAEVDLSIFHVFTLSAAVKL